MRWNLLAALCVTLGTVSIAHAEMETLWNFRGNMPQSTKADNLTRVTPTESGIEINTDTEGYLLWGDQPFKESFDVLTMKVRSRYAMESFYMWQPTDGTTNGLYQMKFVIPASGVARDVHLIPPNHPEWTWHTQVFAIRFPAGSDLVIEEIVLRKWTLTEKIMIGFRSFWTFDDFRGYTINFLWGPLIALNEPARATLYDDLPPYAWTVTRYFYALLLIVGMVSLLIYLKGKNALLALGIFTATFTSLWLLFDVRMGAEILSYAYDDVQSFVLKEGEDRILRSQGNLSSLIENILPILQEHEKFVLISSNNVPFFAHLRYQAYPTLMIPEGMDPQDTKLWVIFDRDDISIDSEQRLVQLTSATQSGKILSDPGTVITRFDDTSFLFETH